MTPTAVLVDDEPLARERLRNLVTQVALVEIIGEAGDGEAALRMIDELEPDLVLLDIEIPPPTGLELLGRLRHKPLVIFTTAFDRYAVTAFELGAVDYLLKPFDLERVRRALERAVNDLAHDQGPAEVERAREALAGRTPLARLYVREGDRTVPLAVEEITRFEARDDYVEVHGRERSYLLRMTLHDLEARLDPQRFIRIHRSHIVGLDQVKAFQPYDARRIVVELHDGTHITASRSGSQLIRSLAK